MINNGIGNTQLEYQNSEKVWQRRKVWWMDRSIKQ